MRRHRGPPGTSPGLSSAPATPPDSKGPPMRTGSLVSWELDLNLPAPADHNRKQEAGNSKRIVSPQPKKQQGLPRLVFSVTALVDCHN
ncbi:hypothetical protein MLD38_003745 [Melastoma candidum]|uniref:Uncharacterized protein n=1 Tax=Melastoma candidum TaxID=119954 RepID=A0ACB9S3F9_9MYRT|nr:hypothetical protein MLD38_003745 [Melastoma candidum]